MAVFGRPQPAINKAYANRDIVAHAIEIPEAEVRAITKPPEKKGPPPEAVKAAAAEVLEVWRHERPDPGAFPTAASRIVELFNQAQPDFNRMVSTLSQDVAVASKLLSVANSAAFAASSKVQDVRGAVMRLGMAETGRISLAIASRALFDAQSKKEFELFPDLWGRLFHDAMTSAFAGAAVGLDTRGANSDRAFLAGMLHDIGKVISLRSLVRLQGKGIMGWAVVSGAVPQILEAVHLDVGIAAMQAWKMPAYLQSVAARHHEPIVPKDPELIETHLIRVIDGVQGLRANNISPEAQQAMQQSSEALGYDATRSRAIAIQISELATRVTQLFGIADPYAVKPVGPPKRK